MQDMLKTDQTYKTRAAACLALMKCNVHYQTRYLIAVNEEGRFAPVVVGGAFGNARLIHQGITVVS